MAKEKLKVSVQEVENLLEKGMNRQEISEHYGISYSILQKTVFQHPKLKGKKARKVYDIEVFDEEDLNTLDLSENVSSQVDIEEETVEEPVENVSETLNEEEEVVESTTGNWE